MGHIYTHYARDGIWLNNIYILKNTQIELRATPQTRRNHNGREKGYAALGRVGPYLPERSNVIKLGVVTYPITLVLSENWINKVGSFEAYGLDSLKGLASFEARVLRIAVEDSVLMEQFKIADEGSIAKIYEFITDFYGEYPKYFSGEFNINSIRNRNKNKYHPNLIEGIESLKSGKDKQYRLIEIAFDNSCTIDDEDLTHIILPESFFNREGLTVEERAKMSELEQEKEKGEIFSVEKQIELDGYYFRAVSNEDVKTYLESRNIQVIEYKLDGSWGHTQLYNHINETIKEFIEGMMR